MYVHVQYIYNPHVFKLTYNHKMYHGWIVTWSEGVSKPYDACHMPFTQLELGLMINNGINK